jgi:two-component system, chemotaxis family, CheB/CheR fusion protein
MTESELTITPPAKLVTAAKLPILQGTNILVVEDDDDILALIATILEQAGASVTAVSSASAALLALQAYPHYDLLLSDLAMPETDGWSLIRQIRALPAEAGGTIPAAALTAYSSKRDRNVSQLSGFQILLSKPIEPAQLTMNVAKLIGTHHPHSSDA